MRKVLKYKDLTQEDHRILKAMFDGLAMCYVVEKEEYPYEETLYEKIQREQQLPDNLE